MKITLVALLSARSQARDIVAHDESNLKKRWLEKLWISLRKAY